MTPAKQASPAVHNGWVVEHSVGPAGPFHDQLPPVGEDPDAEPVPTVWVRTLPRPALVLGSAQPAELVDKAAATADGVEVCRRRSGGGLVFVDPAADCWVDVIVPRSSSRWHDDVGRAFHWVGEVWADVLTSAAGRPVELHTRPRTSPAGRIWCFADLGHGELTIDGSKVLGLSQRRTRTWLRIQTLVLARWPAARLARYVTSPEAWSSGVPEPHPILRAAMLDPALLNPSAVAAGFPPDLAPPAPADLARRFIAELPDPLA